MDTLSWKVPLVTGTGIGLAALGAADALSGCFLSTRDDLTSLVQRAGELREQDGRMLRLRR